MPTTNPVPSTDPSDLLFNAGKLDEVVNGTDNSFTDRLGVARRTVAGMNADFDAQLADAESDLNVYRSDAAASAAEALGYLQTIRATSYGAYASDPATDPLGNPPTVGDEYFNTTANLLKRWNGTTWQASDINTANLAASSGSSLVGYDGGTVQDVLDAVTGATGAASVGYMPAGTGAVATTVQAKLREVVSVRDFGADPINSAATNNSAIQAALNSGAIKVTIPDGFYSYTALTWPSGVEIVGSGTLKRTGTPTAPGLNASAAGTYRISGVTFDDGGHSAQYGCIETNHASAKLYARDVFCHNGYSGILARQAAIVEITGGEFWDLSHNLYFGTNNVAFLPATIDRVTVTNAVSRNARAGGDGLKTVSGVKRLVVIGGRYYSNAQDGLDLFSGVDESMLIGVESYGNGVNGADIKVGVEVDYPKSIWGQRRRVAIIGGFFSNNAEVGIKVFGEPAEGYFQDVLIQSVNIIGNQFYGIQCRGVAPRIIGNLLLGNAVSTASNYSVIYMQGDAVIKPIGGVVANNVIGNNGVAGKTNVGINVFGWESLLIDGNVIGNAVDRTEAPELDRGISTDANCSNIHIVNNQIGSCNTYKLDIAAGSAILGINPGIALKTRGTLTIPSGTTSATVNHNAAGRPAAFTQVRFFPLSAQYGSGFAYPGATSTTQITANVSVAPTSSVNVGWEVDLTGETNTYAVLQ